MKPLLVIGLNSGTSMDGIDAALFRIGPQGVLAGEHGALHAGGQDSAPKLAAELQKSLAYDFEPSLRRKMKAIVASGSASLEDVCRLNVALGEEFAKAVIELTNRSGLSRDEIDLIGSHGQTIWHAPAPRLFGEIECTATMQLGEPAVIAQRTGIPVVGDFRVADMAAGGQGAPLVAFADEVLFGADEGVGVLNIGGIANITVIGAAGRAIMAFDTGPGNMLIDRAAETLFKCDFDKGGELAMAGFIEQSWLQELLAHKYLETAPPKTTGRELFGFRFADDLIAQAQKKGLTNNTIIATLTAFTAATIADQYKRFIQPRQKIERLILGGGGAENPYLIGQLKEVWPHNLEILRHEDFGVSTKFKEALLFALLAYANYFRIPNNVPICTGARRRVVMGKLCLP